MPPAHTTDLPSYKKFPGGVHRRMVRLLSPAGVLYKFMEKRCNYEIPIQRTAGKPSASGKKIRNGESSGCLACRSCESSNLSHSGKVILPVGYERRATGHALSTGNIIVISIHALREESDLGGWHTSFAVSMPRIVRCCLEIRIHIHKRKMPKAIG